MKYQVQLKTTVTAWVDVEIADLDGFDEVDKRQWAADDAVELHAGPLADRMRSAGLSFGPIRLAYDELDESVREPRS